MYRPLGRIFICRVCNHPLDYAFATIDQNYEPVHELCYLAEILVLMSRNIQKTGWDQIARSFAPQSDDKH